MPSLVPVVLTTPVMRLNGRKHRVALAMAAASVMAVAPACGPAADDRAGVAPVYDKTGKLELLKVDANHDGRVDTWSYMDGPRVVRIEIDLNGDGTIDRWEHYAAGEVIARVELSTKRDGRKDRVEFYEKGAKVRAEDDTDGDGRVDKWETYDGPRVASVSFDTMHRGTPDRRLVYAADGSARVESLIDAASKP